MSTLRKYTISYKTGLFALGPFTWPETLQRVEGLIAAGYTEVTISAQLDAPLWRGNDEQPK